MKKLAFIAFTLLLISVAFAADNVAFNTFGGGRALFRTVDDGTAQRTVVWVHDPATAWNYAPPAAGISNTGTAVTVKTAGATGIRNCVQTVTISAGTLGAATDFAIRDGAGGTVLFRTLLHTTAMPSTNFRIDPPVCGTAATLLEILTVTGVTGNVYANLQGFTRP